MNTTKNEEKETIDGIIEQLSEFNKGKKLPEQQIQASLKPRKSFFFDFEIKGSATGEEYRQYHFFLETVTDIMNELGIRIGNNGYSYIIDAVKIIVDRESYDIRMKTDIYPLIAARYGLRNCGAVEHSIRNAINAAYEEQIRDPKCNKMGMFRKKPTNKQLVIHIADVVLRNMCESRIGTAG